MDVTEEQIEAAASALPALAPICRTVLNNRIQLRAMERQKDAELEVIEAKKEFGDTRAFAGPATPPDTADRVREQDEDAFQESIERMKAQESCDLCARLLDGIARVDAADRAVALAEYGRFKQAVDDTDDAAAVRDEIGEMTVLRDVMEREFNMAPSE